jgi:hypothetical protein
VSHAVQKNLSFFTNSDLLEHRFAADEELIGWKGETYKPQLTNDQVGSVLPFGTPGCCLHLKKVVDVQVLNPAANSSDPKRPW